jgi:hypothetical protein
MEMDEALGPWMVTLRAGESRAFNARGALLNGNMRIGRFLQASKASVRGLIAFIGPYFQTAIVCTTAPSRGKARTASDPSLVNEFEKRPLRPPFLSALGALGAVGSAGKQKAADKMPAACLIAINYVNSISHRFE